MHVARTAHSSGQITGKWPIIEPCLIVELTQALAKLGLDDAFAAVNDEHWRRAWL